MGAIHLATPTGEGEMCVFSAANSAQPKRRVVASQRRSRRVGDEERVGMGMVCGAPYKST